MEHQRLTKSAIIVESTDLIWLAVKGNVATIETLRTYEWPDGHREDRVETICRYIDTVR